MYSPYLNINVWTSYEKRNSHVFPFRAASRWPTRSDRFRPFTECVPEPRVSLLYRITPLVQRSVPRAYNDFLFLFFPHNAAPQVL